MMLDRQNPNAPAGARRRILRQAMASTVFVAVLAVAATAAAQTGASVIQGAVVDAVTRQPVKEAIVTVTSPAMQGEQTVLTDDSGFYRVPSLPGGQFSVRVDREGYDSYEQQRIQLRGEVTYRVNVYLVPRSIEGKVEEIEISERPPTIDVGSSSVAATFSEEMIRRVPLSRPDTARGGGVRSYEAVAAAAPQARGDLYGTSISGTTSPENRYMIDGLSVNDAAYGIGTTPLSSDFLKEVTVVTGGYLPEYGRATGGIVTATVKSGSNEIRGSAWTNVTPGLLEGTANQVFEEGSTIVAGREQINIIGDFGTDVGLPLIKDKLWLYLGVLGATTRHKLPRALYATQVDAMGMPIKDENNNSVRTLIPGTERTYDAVANSMQAVGKLSYSPSRNHSLSLTSVATPWRSGGGQKYGYGTRAGAPGGGRLDGSFESLARVTQNDQVQNQLKWTATALGKRLTFENTLGWLHVNESSLPSDGTRPGSRQGLANQSNVSFRRTRFHPITDFEPVPEGYCEPAGAAEAVRCPVSTYSLNGVGQIFERSQDRLQLRSVVTFLAQAFGHHVIKVGVDVERVTNDLHKAVTGGISFLESTAGGQFADARTYGYLVGPDQVVYLDSVRAQVTQWGIGAFAQNSWSVADKVTLNLGLRYDSEYLYNNEGALGIALPNQFAPRIGVIYDPTQSGRAKVFTSYAKYYQQVPLDVADRSLSAEPGTTGLHNSMCDPTDPAKQAACRDRSTYVIRGSKGTYDPDQYYSAIGGGTTPVDPNLKTPTVDEYVFGAEYQVLPESRLALTFTRRRLKNMIEDMSVDEAQTYFIGNPGQGIAAGFPAARRDYDAMTLLFAKEFLDNWLVQASYTLSRLEGNIAGLFRPETGQLDPNINSDFDLIALLPNRSGPLGTDNRHQLRLVGAYDFAIGQRHHINVGAALRGTSGGPTSYLGAHDPYGEGEVFILPRGSGPRLPWNYGSDLSVRYGLSLGNGHVIEGYVNVFNVFNIQGVTAKDQNYTRADVLPLSGGTVADLGNLRKQNGEAFAVDEDPKNPNFGKVSGYQAPRVVTLGLRYNY
jgi:outer membrane receptor protein involved in Fe transport